MDCLLERAQKLRSQILTTQSQAAQLVAASKADSQAWRFANVGELERLVSKMQLSISEFGRKFLLADANDVKKNYTSEDLCAHLAGFLASAADARALQAANASLHRMQRRCKAPGSRSLKLTEFQ